MHKCTVRQMHIKGCLRNVVTCFTCFCNLFLHRPEPTNFLLKCNASVNAVDKVNRNSPLHCAVLAGNVDAAHILLEAGASVDLDNANVSAWWHKQILQYC